ncbi:lytic transglycosylase [Paenibacillus sp. J31TS4]|uniref:lytic transglycosylase domain-containing protein n=1 Tax=Paenibacillus sp. J31TS4 TaxID=2807195 RepID=UPI001B1344EA|nr:lytic transglycosylase domain-containing protein [Paenibacillus sp. J31TS4]GIP38219.1 lytic transglycosylase [Paenibacillus sp. J31TS4]
MKKPTKRRRRLLLVLLPFVLVMVVLFYKSTWIGKLIYPIAYREEIEQYAEKYGVDPYLVAAIIRVESNYNPATESRKGAIGLMQLMPETAEWLLEKEGLKSTYRVEDLNDPHINIRVGTQYVDFLAERFNQNRFEILAAYNAGQGNVLKWRDAGIWDGTLQDVDRIPFNETRRYVGKVDYYYKKYLSIYADGR